MSEVAGQSLVRDMAVAHLSARTQIGASANAKTARETEQQYGGEGVRLKIPLSI